MKKLLLVALTVTSTAYAQQTITSIANGNASNFLIWDCTCIPTTDDDIIINTDVILDVDWLVNAGGSITVTPSGSLIQAGEKNMLIDGVGSVYTNQGVSEINGMAYLNGASGTNSGTFSITQGLYTGPGTTYTNTGLMDGLDSLMTEGTFTTSGTIYTGNFLNTGVFNNSGHIAADSVGNTGTFSSTGGYFAFNAFGNTGTFSMTNAGWMEVSQNWLNAGDFTLGSGLQIYAGADFFSGDTLGGTAFLTNDGMIEVANNFYNSGDLDGTGNICIANESYNVGPVSGTLDICDNTGTDFDFNLGTIGMNVTFCQPGCYVGVEEQGLELVPFPNPATDVIKISHPADRILILSLDGKVLAEGSGSELDITVLKSGSYLLQAWFGTTVSVSSFSVLR